MARIDRSRSALLTIAIVTGLSLCILGCMPPKPDAESQSPTEEQEPSATGGAAAQAPPAGEADSGATGKYSPVKARARDFYAPNTEDLGPDEMRLIACGTGMPTARPKQAASCWLLELGNGDKFIFDIGSGSAERISSLQIPYDYLDKIFIGSCTNGRIEDLRAAAAVAQGKQVADGIKLAMVVPGSGLVKAQAEAEGLDRVFLDAGFEWREPGCSMCLAMNADRLEPGERCAATSNRNFEGRQGQGGRTHLVSPAMAAAAAVNGHFVNTQFLDPMT